MIEKTALLGFGAYRVPKKRASLGRRRPPLAGGAWVFLGFACGGRSSEEGAKVVDGPQEARVRRATGVDGRRPLRWAAGAGIGGAQIRGAAP